MRLVAVVQGEEKAGPQRPARPPHPLRRRQAHLREAAFAGEEAQAVEVGLQLRRGGGAAVLPDAAAAPPPSAMGWARAPRRSGAWKRAQRRMSRQSRPVPAPASTTSKRWGS